MKAWACGRCDQIHTQNPDACRSCGHKIFRPVSEKELRERSPDNNTPESTSVETTVGGAKEIQTTGSPDVNLDGSMSRSEEEKPESNPAQKGIFSRLVSWIRR